MANDGKLGISEASPQRTLHVNGVGKFMSTVTIGGSSGSNDYVGYLAAQSFANNPGASDVSLGTHGAQTLRFATNSTERARIAANGQIIYYQTNASASQRFNSAGYTDTYVFRFAMSMAGNQAYEITLGGFGNGMYWFKAWASHWNGSYRLFRDSYLGLQSNASITESNLHNLTSASQGAFSFSNPSSAKIKVTKSAGNYVGGMITHLEIKGKSSINIDSIS